jgi:integrase
VSQAAPKLDRAVKLWGKSLESAGKAPTTVLRYTSSGRVLVRRFGARADPAQVSVEDLEAILREWALTSSSKRGYVIAWRQFYRWGERRYGWPDVAGQLDIPRRSKPAVRRLTQREVAVMLDTPLLERARTIVWVLTYSAIRTGELRQLRWSDVDLTAGRLTVTHHTKGQKGRIVPLPARLVTYLAGVKHVRGKAHTTDECYLIPFKHPGGTTFYNRGVVWTRPASGVHIGTTIKAAALQAGVHAPNEITAHMFRRFYLEYALDNGMSVYVAAAIAGHASIQMTADYGGGASLAATTRAVSAMSFPSDALPPFDDSFIKGRTNP